MKILKFLSRVILFLLIPAFTCPDSSSYRSADNSTGTIKIGLLVPDSKSVASVRGAGMAVSRANESGGLNSRQFQMVVRTMEGPWGTGSKQAVDLIFNEQVWALLGSHDGRNAHLAEQAATKSTVVFVSAWSGDPTLSQAFVPWFFNCVPNDLQQSAAITGEIFTNRKFTRVAVIHGNDYDSKISLDNFLRSLNQSDKHAPVQFRLDDYHDRLNILFDELLHYDPQCIVILCPPPSSLVLAKELRQRKIDIPVYGSLTILNEDLLSPGDFQYFNDFLSVPSDDRAGSENNDFRMQFQKTYGEEPGMVASYSFDGMNVLIEAIRRAGSPNREKIQKSLENIQHHGVTGVIEFDESGNRRGNLKIMGTKNGVPLNWK